MLNRRLRRYERRRVSRECGGKPKINTYIEKNPKEWSHIQMLRDRWSAVSAQSVQKQSAREDAGEHLKKLDENPEMKEASAHCKKSAGGAAGASDRLLAMRTNRTIAPPAQQQTQGARV